MNKTLKTLGLALALTCLLASTASADAPMTANAGSAFGQLGYGIFTGDDTGGSDVNPYGLGLGLGGGYTLDMGVYLGARFDYFLGDSNTTAGIDSSVNIYQFGLEVGYDLGLAPELVLRPQLGLGLGTAAFEASGSSFGVSVDSSDSQSGLAITPGVAALYDMGGFHLRFDLRYNVFSVEQDVTTAAGTVVTTDSDLSGLLVGIGAGASF